MRLQNRSPFKPRAKATPEIENKTGESTVYIYDEISWFGVNAEQFVKDLEANNAKTINIRFNSPGGAVFDGTSIFNAIKQHKSKTVSHVDGLAASIASVIALAADEVRMAENAFLMIHNPYSMVIGDAGTMRSEADLLDKVGGTIVKTYMDRSGKDEKEIKDMMSAETWMTAEEALEMGFIDTIIKEKPEKAQALFDLAVFANVPDKLLNIDKDINERDIEQALRDAGCSINEAKGILAKGFAAVQDAREVQIDSEDQDVREVQIEETHLREADPAIKKDKTADLLTRAEVLAPLL